MAEQQSSVPRVEILEEIEGTVPLVDRPSDPLKQGIAGLADVPIGLPALFGLVPAAIEAGVTAPFKDESFTQELGSILQRPGLGGQAFRGSVGARQAVNKALSIEEPKSVEDQAARLLSSAALPLPASFASTALGKAALFATPGVALGKGFAPRAGIQLGANVGIDQGLRAFDESGQFPLIFSEQAIEGTPILPPNIEVIDEVEGSSDADVGDMLRDLDDKMMKRDQMNGVIEVALAAASIYGLYKTGKFYGRKAIDVREMQGRGAASRTGNLLGDMIESDASRYPGLFLDYSKNQARDATDYVHRAFVDANAALVSDMKAKGIPDDVINRQIQSSHRDTESMAANVYDNGKLSGIDKNNEGFEINIPSGRALEMERLSLNPTQKQTFDDMPEELARLVDESAQASSPAERALIRQRINTLRSDPQIAKMLDDVSEVYDGHLQYQVKRGAWTPEQAQQLRDRFSVEGKLFYMPLISDGAAPLHVRLGRLFGINTDAKKEMDFIAEFHARGDEVVGGKLDTLTALRLYTTHSMDHVEKSAFKYGSTSILGGFRHVDGKIVRNAGKKAPSAVDTNNMRVIGIREMDDAADIPTKFVTDDPLINAGKFTRQMEKDVIWTQHEGQLVGVYSPKPYIRIALDRPRLGAVGQFFNHYKSWFTKLTTGQLSPFAPISSVFSAQQIATNIAAKEGIRAGLLSEAQSVQGVLSLAKANLSKDIADFAAASIASRSNLFKTSPQTMTRVRDNLERVYQNSVSNHVVRETGRTQAGMNLSEFQNPLTAGRANVDKFVGHFGIDSLKLLWRTWNTLNTSFHEGPAFGAMLKRIGDADLANMNPKQRTLLLREAADFSKDVAGDMRRLGASKAAVAFNASVPFSGAMVQSWASIGRAFKGNWKEFSAGAAALIGIPTMIELVFANSYGDDQIFDDGTGRQWTYRDYYWNGFTATQRANNFIMFTPGDPPWEAMLMPVSPEWGLFRSAVLEGADALFGFSNVGDAGLTGVDGSMFQQSLSRVLDVPLPPLVSAPLSLMGLDVRLGVNPVVPDEPGQGPLSIGLLGIPSGKGSRLTGQSGLTQFANQSIDKDVVAAMQDIFGSAAALYIGVHEAVHTGKTEEGGSLERSAELGLEALGDGLLKQSRYLQPLFGKSLRRSTSNETSRLVLTKRRGLDNLLKGQQVLLSGGRLTVSGTPLPGSSVIPSDDPIHVVLASSAEAILSDVKQFDQDISRLRQQLDSVSNTGRVDGEPVTISRRNDLIDGLKTSINNLKSMQLSTLDLYEREMNAFLSSPEGFNRPIEVDFGTFEPRSNLDPGSVFQAPR